MSLKEAYAVSTLAHAAATGPSNEEMLNYLITLIWPCKAMGLWGPCSQTGAG